MFTAIDYGVADLASYIFFIFQSKGSHTNVLNWVEWWVPLPNFSQATRLPQQDKSDF